MLSVRSWGAYLSVCGFVELRVVSFSCCFLLLLSLVCLSLVCLPLVSFSCACVRACVCVLLSSRPRCERRVSPTSCRGLATRSCASGITQGATAIWICWTEFHSFICCRGLRTRRDSSGRERGGRGGAAALLACASSSLGELFTSSIFAVLESYH